MAHSRKMESDADLWPHNIYSPLLYPEASSVSFGWRVSPLPFGWAIIYLSSALKCLLCPVLVFPALHSGKWSNVASLLHCRHEQHHAICNSSVTKTVHGPYCTNRTFEQNPYISGGIVQKRDQVITRVKTKGWRIRFCPPPSYANNTYHSHNFTAEFDSSS